VIVQGDVERLVEGAAAGDSDALEQLIVAHLPELRGFVDRRLGGLVRAREAVSDVVQSTCREVLEHQERFRFGEVDGFRRWLFATALRKVMNKDRFHTANRRDVRREVKSSGRSSDPGQPSPSAAVEADETLALLGESLESLPEDYRRVVLLSHLAELPRREVARAMGRSEASVRNLLHRALARLAADLGRGRVE